MTTLDTAPASPSAALVVTRTVESSGVTATNFGTAPTGMTWSIFSVVVSIR